MQKRAPHPQKLLQSTGLCNQYVLRYGRARTTCLNLLPGERNPNKRFGWLLGMFWTKYRS